MATSTGNEDPNLLEGSSFEDTLSGGGGNDTLQGYGGDDDLRGDDGDDELWGGAGNDTLYGGAGNDILRADGDPASAFNFLDGGAGNDQLRGSAGDDILDAGGGTDLLQGGDGHDRLSTAQAGRFTLEGGAGNDTFSTLGLGVTSVVNMKGGSGTDTFIATYDPPAAGGSSSLIRCLDFKAGTGGDLIDLSAVLPLVTGLVGIDDPFDKRLGHIRLVQQGADTALQFDPDGKAGAVSAWHTMLLLKSVTASKLTLSNLSGTRNDSTLDVVQGTSTAPTVAAPIPELLAKPGTSISYKLPSGTFADADVGDAMQISVSMAGGRALPGWLAYDAQTQTFTGKLPTGTPQVPVVIVVTATDAAGLSVSDRFAITPATALGDSLRGSAGDDEFDGLAGDDTIDGGLGNDSIEGNLGNDRLLGDAGRDTLAGGDGSDSLFGGDGNDSLAGGANSDSLDGGAGNDTMSGGAGDDRYVVDSPGDKVIEAAGGGSYDIVSTLINDYTLPAEVETLWLGGSSNLSGTGNALSNTIVGNGGNNEISGADGDDTLTGGAGNDTLSGGNGNDRLDGGAGNDRMEGGAGNDTYLVQSSGDTVVEVSGGGIDTVLSALPAYTLGAEIENGRINTVPHPI